MSISEYPSWLPKRPSPPVPVSTYQSSPEQIHPSTAQVFDSTPGRKPLPRSTRIIARDPHFPWKEPTGDSAETRVQPDPNQNTTMPYPRYQPRFRAPSLHLDLLRSPALYMRIGYLLHPVFIFGHLVLQTYFDFNAVFMMLQISSHPGPNNNTKNWTLAATAYIACYVLQIVGVFIIYELIYSFWRRWRVKRPLVLPIYLSAPARNLVALTSYAHYCFLAYIRRSARPSLRSLFQPNSRHGALSASPASSISSFSSSSLFPLSPYIAETCFFLAQNFPTVILLLPRAALCLSLLLQPPAGPGLGRDTTYFDPGNGALSGYAKGVLFANAAWTAWRAWLVLASIAGLWIFSGAACGGICGPRYRWEEEPEVDDIRSPPTSPIATPPAFHQQITPTHYPVTRIHDPSLSDTWSWKRGTRARVRDAWEFCLTNTSTAWGSREKEKGNEGGEGPPGHRKEYSTTVIHARHSDHPSGDDDDDDLAGLDEIIKRSVLGRSSGRQAAYSPREGEGLSDIIPPPLSTPDDHPGMGDAALGSQRSRRSDPLRVLPFPIRVGAVGNAGKTSTSMAGIPFPSPTRLRGENTRDVTPVTVKKEEVEDDVEGIEGLDDLEVGDDDGEDEDVGDVDIEAQEKGEEEGEHYGVEVDEENQEHDSMSSLGRPIVPGEKYPFIGLGTGFMSNTGAGTVSSRNGSRSLGGTASKSGTQSSKGGTRSSRSGAQSIKHSSNGTGSASHVNTRSTYSTQPASTPSHSHSHSHSTHPASSPPHSNPASSPSHPASSPQPPSNYSATPRSDSSASPHSLPPPPAPPARARRRPRRGTGPLPTGLASSAAQTPRSVGTEAETADVYADAPDHDAPYHDINALAARARTRTMSSDAAAYLSGRRRATSGLGAASEPEPQPEPEIGMVDLDQDLESENEGQARGRTRPESGIIDPDTRHHHGQAALEPPRSPGAQSNFSGNIGHAGEDEDSVGLLSPATRSSRHSSVGPSPRASLRSLRSRLSLSVISASQQGQSRSVSHSRSPAHSFSRQDSRTRAISQHSNGSTHPDPNLNSNPSSNANSPSPATRSRAQSLVQNTRSRTQSLIQRSRASSIVRTMAAENQFSDSPLSHTYSNSNSNPQYHSPSQSGGSRRESAIGSAMGSSPMGSGGGSRRESSGLESSSGGEQREREASHAVGIEETFGRPGELARLREIEERAGSGSGSAPASPVGLQSPAGPGLLRHAASHAPSDITEMTEMTERAGGDGSSEQQQPQQYLTVERSRDLTTEASNTDLSTAHESFITAPMTVDGSTTTDSVGTASGAHWTQLRDHIHIPGGQWGPHHPSHEPA